MAEPNDFPFHHLSNDDFHNTNQSHHNSRSSNCDLDIAYDEYVADSINTQFADLDFSFDPNDSNYSYPSSKYYTQKQLTHQHFNAINNEFSLFHCNIRSMNSNFEQLRILLEDFNSAFSVIGITETWFTDIPSSLYSLPGYELIVNNRTGKTGGGVALYVSSQFNFTPLKELFCMSSVLETVFVEIVIPGRRNIVVGTVYRPPQSNQIEFLEALQALLSKQIFKQKNCFILGDFNVNLLQYESNTLSQEFTDTLLTESFLPLITKPTRVTEQSSTLIDNIFTNVQPLPQSGIILSDLTDHFPIFSHFPLHTVTHTFVNINERCYNNENLLRFKESLTQTDWTDIYNSRDPNISFEKFMDIFLTKFNESVPFQRSKSRKSKKIPKSPWITKNLLRSINRKNNLYYKYKVNPTEHTKRKYTNYKNVLTSLLRREKRLYYCRQLNNFKNNCKHTWNIINTVLNKSKDKPQISKLNCNGTISKDPRVMAESFNNYFSQIGTDLASKIPPTNRHFTDFLNNPNPDSLFLDPVDELEILNIINNLDNKKSCGNDGVNNIVIKHVGLEIAQPLTHIINLSISSGIVPNKMKLAKVIPIFKKGNDLEVNNYRPISLLTCLSKILEKVIYIRTIDFLQYHNIFF